MNRILSFFAAAIATATAIALASASCTNSSSQSGADSPAAADPFTTSTIRVGKNPNSVETADFNKDGNPDLAIANSDDSSVTILLNNGKGEFTPAAGSPFPTNRNPNDLAISDLNKDGNPDLCIANTETAELTVLLGNGNGQFSQAPHSPYKVHARPHTHGIAVADYNGDGYLDLATDDWGEDKISIIFGDNTGNFTNQTFYATGKRPYQRLRTADLNADGRPDLITTNLEGNNCTVLLGTTPTPGPTAAPTPSPAAFTEAPGSPYPCGDAPFAVAIGDLNGDGHPDLAICDAPTITSASTGRDGLFILLGDGTGHFHPQQHSPFPTGKSPSRIAIGDLNGDGINDIAVTNYNDNSITIFYCKKEHNPTAVTLRVGPHPDGICIKDFNKDRKNDLAVTSQTDGTVTVLLHK